MSLRQKRVAVVGGTSGIGRAVAQGAMAEGAQVVVGSSSADKLGAIAGKLQGAEAIASNVREEASVEAFFTKVGPFDHLVFTAGDWGQFRDARTIDQVDLDQARELFAVRFWGAGACVKHAHKYLREGATNTHTDGTKAQRPRKGAPLSTAMAGGIEHLVRGLAVALAPIRVNGVCQAGIRTDVWNSISADVRESRILKMIDCLFLFF